LLRIILKKGREVPVLRGHPWIFSGAIEEIDGNANAAGVADVFDWEKHWIARGLFSPKSQIRVRLLIWQKEEIDGDFFFRRISRSLSIRESILSRVTNAYRIVNGEGDFLPGLIVDRYSEFLVCQFFTAGMDCFKPLSSSRSQIFLLRRAFLRRAKGEFETRKASRRQSAYWQESRLLN